MKENKVEINIGKEIYEKRWSNSLKNGDYDILSRDENLDNQVQYFYNRYCEFILNKIKAHFKNYPYKNLRILEIGCGRGTASIYLSKKLNCKVTGIDFSKNSIEIAKKNAKFHFSKAEFFIADLFEPKTILEKTKNTNKAFDIIISLGVLEHIEQLNKCFQIHNELLDHNGFFCAMIVPEKKSIQNYFSFINRLLSSIALLISPKFRDKFSHLDKKTLSKTKDVYRSYKSAKYFKDSLIKANFINVVTIESNPYPTLRPLNRFFEKFVVKTYMIIEYLFYRLFKKSIFFNCSTNFSRCHFLIGTKN